MLRVNPLFIFMAILCINSKAQSVGIGQPNIVPNPNAVLDVRSSTKGVLLPRTSTVNRLAMPATKGMLVYDTTIGNFCYNTGSGWLTLESSSAPTPSTITGYWKGVVSNIMTIMHRANGTASLYLFYPTMTSLDTTAANAARFDGTWQLNGDVYTSSFGSPATSAYNFTAIVRSPAAYISGTLEAIAPNSAIGLAFYMIKQ